MARKYLTSKQRAAKERERQMAALARRRKARAARKTERASEKETFKDLPGKRDPFKAKGRTRVVLPGSSSGPGQQLRRGKTMDERMDALERKILGYDPVERRKKERAKRKKEWPVDLPSATPGSKPKPKPKPKPKDRTPGPDIPLGTAVWKGMTAPRGKPYTQKKPYKKKK
jgi:hypothetical protein